MFSTKLTPRADSFSGSRTTWKCLFVVGATLLLAIEGKARDQPAHKWTVGTINVIAAPDDPVVSVKWRVPPVLKNWKEMPESGCILTLMLVDARNRQHVLTMRGGDASGRKMLRAAMRRALVEGRFSPGAPAGIKAWFAVYFNAGSDERTGNSPVMIREITPVFLEAGELNPGKMAATRRIAVNANGVIDLLKTTENPGSAKTVKLLTETAAGWKFSPARIDGHDVYGEIDVPFLPLVDATRSSWFMPPVGLEVNFPKRSLWMRLHGASRGISVGIDIGKDGRIKKAEIVSSSGSDSFDAETLEKAKSWTFVPGIKNGMAYDTKLVVNMRNRATEKDNAIESPAAENTEVRPPHATVPFNFSEVGKNEKAMESRVQIRMTIDKSGMMTDALIERAERPEVAGAIIKAYQAIKWIPAQSAGISTDYTFRIIRPRSTSSP